MFGFLNYKSGQTLADAYPSLPVANGKYQTNNQYSKFPPLTSDGRNVMGSWQPGAELNEALLRENGIQSNWQYRKYMTSNANEIRAKLFQDALSDVGYSVRNVDARVDSNGYQGPKLYGSIMDSVAHEKGELSDLKANYMTREQLQSKMVVPSMTQAELIALSNMSK